VSNDAVLVGLGSISSPEFTLAIIGLVITGVLLAFKVKGALLLGIVASTLIGFPLGLTQAPSGSWAPPSLAPIFLKFDFSQVFSLDMFIVLFTFLLVDMFDTVGTLIGVSTKAGMLSEDGKIPRAKQALFADAVGTTVGAMLGTSTVTTYVESAAGVEEGGRTGLTSLVVAGLFLLSLFVSPLFLMIPGAATAPALIMVGIFMITPIKEMELNDITEALPAFLTMFMMPLTYSISEGIVFGITSYVILKVLSGKAKQIPILTYVVAAIFIVSFFI
ncbi:MAG: NCS2 family permease, partial [Okeania sp. SIO3B3]|nr:NCS2 family permease [Okeania sp. SIO3B3]